MPAGGSEPLAPTGEPALPRRWAWAGLALVLALALALRLWGVAEGLPYVYDLDEAAHFVPRAIAMSGLHLNPHYFANPPALTYLLHVVFAARFGGHTGVTREAALHPGEVYLVARITVAALGVVAVWLLYVLGASLFGRAVGLLAAALEAVAFLPVFYAHLALNDVPTLVPLTASLIGSVGIVKRGRARDYLLAGVALGLATATKYTAGVVVLPLLAAVLISHRASRADRSRRALPALGGLLIAGVSALLAFLVANPYALLDFHSFAHELAHESAVAEEAGGKLGSPHELGVLYYLWSFTWGLGFIPALAALGGLVMAWFRDRRIGWLLTPMVLAYLVFMGTEDRYFGRWLMPLLPLACVLAAFFALTLAFALARRLAGARAAGPERRRGALAFALCAAARRRAAARPERALQRARGHRARAHRHARSRCAPGCSRTCPPAHRSCSSRWCRRPGCTKPRRSGRSRRATARARAHQRWSEYPLLLKQLEPVGSPSTGHWHVVRHYLRVEDYEHTLTPALLDYYEQQGYCWVITSSIQSGRAYADPGEAPGALAYYAALARRAHLVHVVSPYTAGSTPVGFSFDWSFDYYPLSYRLPGPEMRAYRLHGARCASGA